MIRRGLLAGLLSGVVSFATVASPAAAASPTPLAELGQAKGIVVALANRAPDSNARALLVAAAQALTAANEPSLWVDPSHVVAPPYGETLFKDTMAALRDLQAQSPAATALIAEAVRGVAQAMITEAAGGDSAALARAQNDLQAGTVALYEGRGASALTDLDRAWQSAFAALTQLAVSAVTAIPPAELTADAEAALANPALSVYSPNLQTDTEALREGDRLKLLFLDWEFCPYCATQSWGLSAALSQFGTLHGLRLISSDPRDQFSVSGFTFRAVSYSSPLLALESVVQYSSVPDPKTNEFDWPYRLLQMPTPDEAKLLGEFDSFRGAPFLDLGNIFTTLGSSVNIEDLRGLDWAQIVAALHDSTSVPAQAIAATAETITAEVCEATDEHPASICQAPIVRQYEEILNGATGGGFCGGASTTASASRATVRRPKRARRVRLLPLHGKPRAHATRCSV